MTTSRNKGTTAQAHYVWVKVSILEWHASNYSSRMVINLNINYTSNELQWTNHSRDKRFFYHGVGELLAILTSQWGKLRDIRRFLMKPSNHTGLALYQGSLIFEPVKQWSFQTTNPLELQFTTVVRVRLGRWVWPGVRHIGRGEVNLSRPTAWDISGLKATTWW